MITLYERTDCPFCWKVRLALAELGRDYSIVATRLGEKHPEVLRLSPTGTVPVMVEGDLVIWESGVMLDYLDACHGPGLLIPTDPLQQAWVRTIHTYADKCLGPALFGLVREKRSKPSADWDQALIAESEAAWQDCQAWLESQLQPRWMGGSLLNMAECALASRFGVAKAYGVPVTADFPGLYAWFEAVKSRPGWDAAFPTSFPVRD